MEGILFQDEPLPYRVTVDVTLPEGASHVAVKIAFDEFGEMKVGCLISGDGYETTMIAYDPRVLTA